MTARRGRLRRGRPYALFLGVAAVLFALDQVVKAVAAGALGSKSSVPLLGSWVRLKLIHNTGSAFGLVSSGWVLIVVGVAVCGLVVGYVVAGRGLEAAPARALPLGLVLGGSLGNLLDRVRTGAVTDYIDLRVWPVFNLADIAITVGVGLLAIGVVRRR